MKLSARNQFKGVITDVQEGAVNAIVKVDAGDVFTATISMAAVKELGLVAGKEAYAVIKATSVMVGTGELTLSSRNKFAGKVTGINEGAVNAIVSVETSKGNTISATISMAAVKELELAVGMDVVAVIKATEVMIGIDE
jgi:molybdate transport system regulatory protein